MLRSIALLVAGIILGIAVSLFLADESTPAASKADELVEENLPEEELLSEEWDDSIEEQDNRNQRYALDCDQNINSSDQTVDDTLVKKLARSRAILPTELSLLNHWFSRDDLEEYIKEFDLTTTTYNRILAKGEIHFNKDYLAAIRLLYTAIRDADEASLKVAQTELYTLVDYIQRMFFASSPEIDTELFLSAMYIVNEKQPDYVPAIEALVRHHNFLGEYDEAGNYIERIPQDYENDRLIKSLQTQVEKSKSEKDKDDSGIPMEKRGDHFVVNVTLDNKVGLKLMLDTGASRTALSKETIRTVRRLSSDFESLGVGRFVRTANGYTQLRVYQGKVLEVGGFQLFNPVVFSADLGPDDDVQGLLGMDFLGKFQFRIDHEKSLLYLSH